MKCICGSEMILRSSKYGKFWGCIRFPECRNTHGAHPNGKPLGIPADKETRELRIIVHALLDEKFNYKTKNGRKAMYKWLKENTALGHISMTMKDELIRIMNILTIIR